MTFKLGSKIKEQASSSGLADFTLAGAVQNFRPFASLLTVDGDTTWYYASNGGEFEAGLGTRTGPSGLARTTVLESSAAGNAKVNFSAPPIVYCEVPASQIPTVNSAGFTAHASAGQVLAAGTNKLTFDAIDTDTTGNYSTTNSRFTAGIAGWYQLQTTFAAAAGFTNNCMLMFYKNGAEVRRGMQPNASTYTLSHSALVYLNVGDYVEVWLYSANGVTGVAGIATSAFAGALIAPTLPQTATVPPVMFSAKANSQQALTQNGYTKLLFPNEEIDTDNVFDAPNGRFQPTRPGWYWLTANAAMTNGTGYLELDIYKNGVLTKLGTATGTGTAAHASGPVYLNGTTDYAEVFVYTSIAGQTVLNSYACTFFSGFLMQGTSVANNVSAGPVFSVKPSATQALTNAAYTKIAFGVKEFDSHGAFDTVNSRFQPTVPGYYRISGQIHMSGAAQLEAMIYKNGVAFKAGGSVSANTYGQNATALVYLNGTSDYVELYAFIGGAGITTNASFASGYTHFEGEMVNLTPSATPATVSEPWHYIGNAGEPAFQNGFANFDANHRTAYYMQNGRVYVKGLVKGGGLATVFTLPVGYRPDQEIRFATSVNGAFGSLVVSTNGNVAFEAGNPSATWGALDAINFRAA